MILIRFVLFLDYSTSWPNQELYGEIIIALLPAHGLVLAHAHNCLFLSFFSTTFPRLIHGFAASPAGLSGTYPPALP